MHQIISKSILLNSSQVSLGSRCVRYYDEMSPFAVVAKLFNVVHVSVKVVTQSVRPLPTSLLPVVVEARPKECPASLYVTGSLVIPYFVVI